MNNSLFDSRGFPFIAVYYNRISLFLWTCFSSSCRGHFHISYKFVNPIISRIFLVRWLNIIMLSTTRQRTACITFPVCAHKYFYSRLFTPCTQELCVIHLVFSAQHTAWHWTLKWLCNESIKSPIDIRQCKYTFKKLLY